MNTKLILKLIGVGILLFIINLILDFIQQMIGGHWLDIIVILLMTGCSLWFSRLMHTKTRQQAFLFGLTWAIVVTLIFYIDSSLLGNGFFNQWGPYLTFLGVTVGPIILKPKQAVSKNENVQSPNRLKLYLPRAIALIILLLATVYVVSDTIHNVEIYNNTLNSSGDYCSINQGTWILTKFIFPIPIIVPLLILTFRRRVKGMTYVALMIIAIFSLLVWMLFGGYWRACI
jgi:hypothetical protein